MERSLLLEDGGRFRVTKNTVRIPEPVWPAGDEFDPPVAELLVNETQGALTFKGRSRAPRRLHAPEAVVVLDALNRARAEKGAAPVRIPKRLVRAALHQLAMHAAPLPWPAEDVDLYRGNAGSKETLLIHKRSADTVIRRETEHGVKLEPVGAGAAWHWLEQHGHLKDGAVSFVSGMFVLQTFLLNQFRGRTDDPPPRSRGSG